jgi:hypothetical protein
MRNFIYPILVISTLFGFDDLYAQEKKSPPEHQHLSCPMSLEEHEMEAYANHVRAEQAMNREILDGTYNIPVQFHLLRRTNGTGGITPEEAAWELDQANIKYQWMGVEFFQCTPARFIDDDGFFNTEFQYDWDDFCGQDNAEYQIAGQNNVPDVVNIYYVNTDGWNWSCFPDDRTERCKDWIIMDIDDIGFEHLLAHELGHYFNLLHTFQGYEDSDPDNNEHIVRNSGNDCYNCNEAGDWLCDTPADNNRWDDDCNWDGTGSDGCSDFDFTPDEMNIMSYCDCAYNFTEGQEFRIIFTITTSRSYLDCPFLSDCEPTHTLSSPQNGMFAFQASNTITSTADINSGAVSAYDAGNSITLQPGFHAKAGSSFTAFIDGCWGPVIYPPNE